MKRWTKWTDEEHERLAVMVREGCTVVEIAQELDRIPDVVRHKKRELGLFIYTYAPSCVHCGKPMDHAFRGRPRRYCTDECRADAVSARARRVRQEAKGARQDWTCVVCGGPLPEGCQVKRIYCSKACDSRAWYLRAKAAEVLPYQRKRAERSR